VRVAVLNDTLEQAFRSWHTGLQATRESSRVLRGVSTPLDCMLSLPGASNCNGASTYAVFSSDKLIDGGKPVVIGFVAVRLVCSEVQG